MKLRALGAVVLAVAVRRRAAVNRTITGVGTTWTSGERPGAPPRPTSFASGTGAAEHCFDSAGVGCKRTVFVRIGRHFQRRATPHPLLAAAADIIIRARFRESCGEFAEALLSRRVEAMHGDLLGQPQSCCSFMRRSFT